MPDEFQKFAIFTVYGESLPVAYHLKQEGKEVIVAMVDDLKNACEESSEDKVTHSTRWSQYNGMMDILTCEEALKKLSKENPEEWAVIFDFNSLWKYADQARALGFKYGLFPTMLDHRLEEDRDFAKKFVVKNYPGVKVAEVEEFKTVDEGIEFIGESDEFWALKGNDPSCSTCVPRAQELENVKAELIDQLQSGKESFEKKGFILERQIRDGLEVCPQMIWMDGKRVAVTVDIEDKAFSATDSSEMFGCSLNMIIDAPLDCELNQVAFPSACDKLAKAHTGLFYLDANLIMKDGEYYFLEFCPNRWGFDAIYAEMEMAGKASDYLNSILHGESPYNSKYGAGVRGFMQKREDDGTIKDGITIRFDEDDERHIWLFGVKQSNGKITNMKGSYGDIFHGIDLMSITEDSDDMEYAIIKMREVVNSFSFNGLYLRDDWRKIKERAEKIEKFIQPCESNKE